MRVAIIAPPFIPVPPPKYGGTELFIAQLATGLTELGHDVVVYANGESRLPCEVRWLYETVGLAARRSRQRDAEEPRAHLLGDA